MKIALLTCIPTSATLAGKRQVGGNDLTKDTQESSLEQQQPFDNALKSILEGQEEDKQMIQERLSMYDDLMENDPEMQRLRAKYKTEGLAEGKAETLQTNILTFIKARFPTLTKQARQCVSTMTDIDDLQDLFEQLVSLSDEAKVRELLIASIA